MHTKGQLYFGETPVSGSENIFSAASIDSIEKTSIEVLPLAKEAWQTNGKPGVVVHACDLSIWVLEAGISRLQSQPQLYSEFMIILGYETKK